MKYVIKGFLSFFGIHYDVSTHTTELSKFLFHGGKDNVGRTLDDYLAFSYEEMEVNHDYIQWMFPTTEPSAFNPNAPILTHEDIREMVSFKRYSVFEESAVKYLDFLRENPDIFSRNDHNHLRITRVIKCLRQTGCFVTARLFYIACISMRSAYDTDMLLNTSVTFWNEALKTEPLNIR